MEESLIAEVQNRPILYDRSLDSYKKLNAREKAWKEVARILGTKEFECRRRWRTLRDSFIKLYRSTKQCNPNEGARKKQWVYYDQMSFLIPHIEQKPNENSYETELSESNKEEPQYDEYNQGYQPQDYPITDTFQLLNEVATETLVSTEIAAKRRKRNDCQRKSTDTFSADEQFLLSCAPALTRLSYRHNAIAKMKILQVLYELEFESADYGRPASSASIQSANSQEQQNDLSSLLTPVTVVEDGQEDIHKN